MKCSYCGMINAPGVLICGKCGRVVPVLATKQIRGPLPEPAKWAELGSEPYAALMLRIEGTLHGVAVQITDQITVGRWDGHGEPPAIDLAPYGGYDAGVSRAHAILRREGRSLTVRDLNSANGTWLDGAWLTANKTYALNDGAQLTFGKLRTLLIYTMRGTAQ